MRTLAYLRKTFIENLREWKILVLALVFAPGFVFIMYGYFGAATQAYGLLVLDRDGAPESRGLIVAWQQARHADGTPVFTVTEVADLESARERVKNRDADLLVEIPAGFSRGLLEFKTQRSREPAPLVNHVDERNLRGSMAMAYSDYLAYTYAVDVTDVSLPLSVSVRGAGRAGTQREFDMYVPALLVLAIIMVLFTAAASLIKEVDKGTMTRLMLSRLRTGELLAAVTINQVLIGTAALTLAYGAALVCGYDGQGSLGAVLVVGILTTVAVVAIAVMTAAFLRTIFELLTVGCFPFFLLMFFSECMFPLPRIRVAEVLGHAVYANDILPTTLCVRAFNRIMNQGAGLMDLGFELGAILTLTVIYFAGGAFLFRRRHQRI
jgi:ABC-2 type transport system permease protein